MNVFGAPLEVVHELTAGVRFLEDESVVEELTKFVHHIDVRIISNSATQLPELSLLLDEFFWNLVELGTNLFELKEVEFLRICLHIDYILADGLYLVKNIGYALDYVNLLLLRILKIS